eukprot:6196885-Prymnesium_polylepis.1
MMKSPCRGAGSAREDAHARSRQAFATLRGAEASVLRPLSQVNCKAFSQEFSSIVRADPLALRNDLHAPQPVALSTLPALHSL